MKSEDAAESIAFEAAPAVHEVREAKREIVEEAPLVGTLRFVFVMGASFAVLWLVMYALLRVRW